jgi:HK97 family phage major capsid protein
MKRFRIIMTVCLTLLVAAVAIPLATSFFDAGSIEQIFAGSAIALAVIPVLGKLETSKQVKEARGTLYQLMQDMNTLVKTEKREFTADEQTQYDEYANKFDELKDKLTRIEADERRMAEMAGAFHDESGKEKRQKEIRSYSLVRAIKLKVQGKELDGLEGEMHQEAVSEARDSGQDISGFGIPSMVFGDIAKRNEKRALSATGQTSNALDQGGMMIATEKEGLIMALRPMLLLAKLGAKSFGGMIGNLDLVKGTSTTVGWETENGEADETTPVTSKITVTPRRLAAFTKIGKQLLAQTSPGIQDDVMNDILAAIAQAVEVAAIHGGGSNEPTGLLATTGIGDVAGGTDGAVPTYAHITQLEAKVEIGNGNLNTLAYLTNPKVKNQLKNTKIDTGSGIFVWGADSNILNGHPAYGTNLVPSTLTKGSGSGVGVCSAIAFGDFSQMHIYNWAGLDITVDPYTLAKTHQIQLTVNSFWDVAIKHPAAFAAMLDALTTL